MQYLKIIFRLFLFSFLFLGLSTTFTNADNNSINGSCPGEWIQEIQGATADVTRVEPGRIGGNGNDRYRMSFAVDGELDITSNANRNFLWYVSRNSCGNNNADWNIVSAQLGNSHSTTNITINAGDTIYIRHQSLNIGTVNYSTRIEFTATPANQPPNAVATVSPTEGLAGTNFSFDATSSDNGEGGTSGLSYVWREGGTTLSTSAAFSKNDFSTGMHTITLTVTDADGLTDSTDVTIEVIPPRVCDGVTGVDGLEGNYYNNRFFNTPVVLSRTDPTVNFNWGGGSPDPSVNNDNFSVEWTGELYVPETADYIFSLAHDDVMTLIIDGTTRYNSSSWTGGSNNYRDTGSIPLSAGTHTITLRFVEWGGGAYARLAWRNNRSITSRTIIPSGNLCSPPVQNDPPVAHNKVFSTPAGDPLTRNLMTQGGTPDFDPDNDPLTAALLTPPALGSVTVAGNGLFTYTPPNSTYIGPVTFQYAIFDGNGDNNDTATVTINITMPSQPVATPNSYDTQLNVPISGNVMADGTPDTGANISVVLPVTTAPTNGTLSLQSNGQFTYSPGLNFEGTDTFTYTIIDVFNRTASALVTIDVNDETQYHEGLADFVLTNPQETRNMVGNYAILGNTVQCITEKRGSSSELNSYNGTCQNSQYYNDNNYMAKSIDIDGDSGIGSVTWNSTSSNFTLPDTYHEIDNGSGIAWAGIFWQGALHNNAGSYKQRRPYLHNGTIAYKHITSDESLDMESTDANKLLVRIDNDATYTPVKADYFYYDRAHSWTGGYYAAYADITNWVRSKQLQTGEHTITVANITANEGRQTGTGNYAGWSIVVIYKEEAVPEAKARNISVYRGYTQVYNGFTPPAIEISGFKLPNSGEVNAQFAAFAGEGEYIYGDGAEYDRMVISRNADLSNSQSMPGATDPNNIFDAILAGIDRDSGNNNNMTGNNNGIDVENYDVSDIMTAYRNADENINTVYIGLTSTQDYITPSMMAFSAELYKPNVCYDYVVKRDDYTLPSTSRTVDAYVDKGDDLSFTVAIKSLESDFDLNMSKVAITMENTSGSVSFNAGKSEYSPTTSNILLPTAVTGGSTQSRPEIAIGKYRNPMTGGTIGPFEKYFAKFHYDVVSTQGGKFQTDFNVELNTTIDFGSGPVSQLIPLPRCEQSAVYNPQWGEFNIERDYSSATTNTERYSLYTQVSGKDFDYAVAHYDTSDPQNPLAIDNATVDVELIDATAFDDNSSFLKCANTDPSIIIGGLFNSRFVKFPQGTPTQRVSVTLPDDLDETPALKAAAFRMWLLLDENRTLIRHNLDRNDGAGFRTIYETYYRDTMDTSSPKLCGTDCNAANGVNGNDQCYNCLRTFFASPICSRDNFAIRPDSYRITIDDAGPNGEYAASSRQITVNDATMSEQNLAAEYDYELNVRSTRYRSEDTANMYEHEAFTAETLNTLPSPNLYQDFAAMEFSDSSSCQDQNHTTLKLFFRDGVLRDYNLSHNNAGDYSLWIEDNTWTKVDQASNNPNKTVFDSECDVTDANPTASVPAHCDDCVLGANTSGGVGADNKVGCTLDSDVDSDSSHVSVDLHFDPYQFDLSSVGFRVAPNDANDYVYMNDLNKSMGMAAKLEGNITAQGKAGTRLSNFTYGCAAEDVILWLDRTMIPEENNVTDENGTHVPFRQVLVDINNIATMSADRNVTLGRENFSNTLDLNGTAEVDLYYNFEKPYDRTVNPVDVNFSFLNGVSPASSSNAHMQSLYTPDGNTTINQMRYFYFSKVAPELGDQLIETYKETASTFLRVAVFCQDNALINCSLMGLDNADIEETLGDNVKWYRMVDHLSSNGDGEVLTLSSSVAGVSISDSSNVWFDHNGSTQSIDFTYPINSTRPIDTIITITPDEWLKYDDDDPTGLPQFTIRYLIEGLKWKGEGMTGHVIETEPKAGSSTRMNW